MQQLKLLNFYKLLANIATKLVGAYIPLIVLQATGSVALAALSIALQYVVRIGFNFLFRKWYSKAPQIALLFRIISVLGYSFCILLINVNVWLGVAGVILFYGLDESLKSVPQETLFNYATTSLGEKSSLGFSRLLEQVGVLVALVVGGVMLDINKTLIILISVIIYAIAIIPLIIFYFKSRGSKTFNQDAVSNATIRYEKNPERKAIAEKYNKKILWSYAITYFIYCFQDVFTHALNLYLFLNTGSYGVAGYLTALYNGTYGIGCFIFDIIAKKKDTTILVSISCLLCSGCMFSTFLTKNIALLCAICSVAGFAYGLICTFNLERLLPKCRILGVANNALFYRENASNCSVIATSVFGLLGSMTPILIVTAVAMAASAIIIPVNEERTRKQLIYYLQNHEQSMSEQSKKLKRVKKA